ILPLPRRMLQNRTRWAERRRIARKKAASTGCCKALSAHGIAPNVSVTRINENVLLMAIVKKLRHMHAMAFAASLFAHVAGAAAVASPALPNVVATNSSPGEPTLVDIETAPVAATPETEPTSSKVPAPSPLRVPHSPTHRHSYPVRPDHDDVP